MNLKRAGAIAIRSFALLALVAAYGAVTESCLTPLWSFTQVAGGKWLPT